MSTASGSRLRPMNARQGTWIALASTLIIAGVLAALAPIHWLLGIAAHIATPDTSAVQPGLPHVAWQPTTAGPAYIARLRGPEDDRARLVTDRSAGSFEAARAHRIAPCRRAPTHPERWLAHELTTCGHAAWPTSAGAAISSEAVERSSAKERRHHVLHTSFQRDVHAPRGPPATPLA